MALKGNPISSQSPDLLPTEIVKEITQFRNKNRSKGTIRFRLEDFPAFFGGSRDTQTRSSSPIYIRGLKWHIEVYPSIANDQRYLSLSLVCSPPTRYEQFDWSIEASYTLNIHRLDDGSTKFHSASRSDRMFYGNADSSEISHGFPKFLETHKIWNADNKLLSADNSIELSCDIEALSGVHGAMKSTRLCVEGVQGLADSTIGFKRFYPSFEFDGFNWLLQVARSSCGKALEVYAQCGVDPSSKDPKSSLCRCVRLWNFGLELRKITNTSRVQKWTRNSIRSKSTPASNWRMWTSCR